MGVNERFAAVISAPAFILLASSPAFAALPGESLWIVGVFSRGGMMMWPILLCSVLAVAIFFDRWRSLRRSNVIHTESLAEIKKHWESGAFDKALKVCEKFDNAMSRIVRAGLLRSQMGVLEIERAIEGAGAHEAGLLTSNLRGLGVLATIAPMFGFLGTVTGMINAFNVIAAAGPGNPSLVAKGIAEALITTAAGLLVGIPAFAAYHFLRGKADRLILEMEELSIVFVEEITSRIVGRGGKE